MTRYALLAPLEVVLSWPKPNYVDPPDRGPAVFAVTMVMVTLTVIVMVLRLYSRTVIKRAFGIDDALAIVATLYAIVMTTLVGYSLKVFHIGRHVWDIEPNLAEASALHNYICQYCYVFGAAFIKVSVLLFYRRVAINVSRRYMWFIKLGILYNIVYLLAFTLVLLFQCRPMNAYWKVMNIEYRMTAKYQCLNETKTVPLSGVFSVFGDIYSTVLPCFAIKAMHLNTRQRRVLYGLFSIGGIVILAGIARTAMSFYLVHGSYDFTWHAMWAVWLTAVIELDLAIICASAPALKPFFGKILASTVNSRGGTDKRSSRQYAAMGSRGSVPVVGNASAGKRGAVSRIYDMDKITVRTEISVHEADLDEIEKAYNTESDSVYTIKLRDDIPLRPTRQISSSRPGSRTDLVG